MAFACLFFVHLLHGGSQLTSRPAYSSRRVVCRHSSASPDGVVFFFLPSVGFVRALLLSLKVVEDVTSLTRRLSLCRCQNSFTPHEKKALWKYDRGR